MAVQAQPQFPFYGSQDWIDGAIGCGGGGIHQFHSSYVHNQQQQLLQQQCDSHLFQNCSSVNDSFSLPKMAGYSSLSNRQSMAAYEDKQRQEVDSYIRLQSEKLRLLIREQREQQIALLMSKIESKALPLMRKKDEEIKLAAKRTTELEDLVKRLETENQAWQRAAQENEAMVISLNSTIEQLREKAATSCFDNGADDAESCCDVLNREDEHETLQPGRGLGMVAESYLTQERKKKMKMTCKGCNSRDSCVLFLPCRHLCSCKACEPFLESCPVCLAGKKATIEAFIV